MKKATYNSISQDDTLRWFVVQTTVPHPTSLDEWRVDEYKVDFNQFVKLAKVYFFKQSSDMIYNEEVQSIKTKKNLKTFLE